MEQIEINKEFIKLGQLLKFMSVADSGGDAKKIILEGNVLVNDSLCLERGKKIFPNDIVIIYGKKFEIIKNKD